MGRLVSCISSILLITACSGSRNGEEGPRLTPAKERLIDALTLFVELVQGDRFDKAMDCVTAEEKAKMVDASGQVPPSVQKQLKAVRLSTLAAKPGVRLEQGKLTGIYAWLPNIDSSPNGTPKEPPAPLIQ